MGNSLTGKNTSAKANLRQYVMLAALVIIIIFFEIGTKGVLLYPQNISNLIQQNAYVFILAVGMVLCIITGGNIDLSVGSIVAFIGAVTATLIIGTHVNLIIAIIISLGMGVLIGIWQGFWIAYIKIPSFIVTLSGMLVFRGLTNTVLQGMTLSPFPQNYQDISCGFLPDIFGTKGFNVVALILGIIAVVIFFAWKIMSRRNKIKNGVAVGSLSIVVFKIIVIAAVIIAFTYALAKYSGTPYILFIILVLVGIYTFITSKTIPGRHIYALGGNAKAARLSGINTKKVLFLVYVNMALLAAVAGIVVSSRLNAAQPQAGTGFELDAIAACFIGGASATGGVGTVPGVITGALVMGVLNNGMSIMGVGSDWQMTIKGLVLLAAVAFDVLSKAKTKE